jgi:hypothetical protein
MSMSVAIVAGEAGTAILTYTRDGDRVDVKSIDRLAAGLGPAVDWLSGTFPEFPKVGDARVVIDSEGLGQALWNRLKVSGLDGWTLYELHGRDRQELSNALLVAESEKSIHIASSPHGEALRKALLSFSRVLDETGRLGGELVTALALAVLPPPPEPVMPFVIYGRPRR